MNIKRLSIILVSLGFLSGCAFGDAQLDIGYDGSKAIAGPLSKVSSQQILIREFKDERPEINMVGYKRNGYGQHTADIKPNKPVPEIVKDAISAVFIKGGHSVAQKANIEVSGEIKTFWFDTKTGFWTVEFMGDTAINLVVKDTDNSNIIYEKVYRGAYNEKSAGGLEKTWERVLNGALAKMAENISLDTELADALKKHAQSKLLRHAELSAH